MSRMTTPEQTVTPCTVPEESAADPPAWYTRVRDFSTYLCEPLEIEDYCVQSMPDVSPAKWHLAHTTWFFETFLLRERCPGYRPLRDEYAYLFNSYYQLVGPQWTRARRGVLSRPTVKAVDDYRRHVDEAMKPWLAGLSPDRPDDRQVLELLELGLHHEQQHQELMLMDMKHVFASNPLHPVYRDVPAATGRRADVMRWHAYDGGVRTIGHDGGGFCYDNEQPMHEALLQPFELGSRLITNGEYLEFIQAGGYRQVDLWLSLGWDTVQAEAWQAPLYWEQVDGAWYEMTLGGFRPLDPDRPVCHLSYFEADAFARWAGARLPREAEWEIVAREQPVEGNFVESCFWHPIPAPESKERKETQGPAQMFGDLWEWTASPYAPYPGYRPPEGAIGEYNGKFMCNQYVLRGGCCATSFSHIRPTYRNFFPPEARWPFTGLRLARDA